MTHTKEVQEYIFTQTGIKASVKKGVGSMKGYFTFSPMFQDGIYPKFPFDFIQALKPTLPSEEPHPSFCSIGQISIYGLIDNRQEFKKERKPKPIEEIKVRQWGSKSSQMRLDKAARRNAKKMNKGGTARYY